MRAILLRDALHSRAVELYRVELSLPRIVFVAGEVNDLHLGDAFDRTAPGDSKHFKVALGELLSSLASAASGFSLSKL